MKSNVPNFGCFLQTYRLSFIQCIIEKEKEVLLEFCRFTNTGSDFKHKNSRAVASCKARFLDSVFPENLFFAFSNTESSIMPKQYYSTSKTIATGKMPFQMQNIHK